MGAELTDWRAAAASALEWWRDAGVDVLVDESPRDWLAPPVPAPAPAAAPDAATSGGAPVGMPATLAEFLTWRTGTGAPEAAWRGPHLPPEGDPAGLFVVTNPPEREDSGEGRLMTGAQGMLFDRMLAAIGLDRARVHLVPVATARPPAGRLGASEAERLGAVLRHHLALAKPSRVLLMGETASRALLGMDCARARGRTHFVNHEGGRTAVIASFHPRLLLQRPAAKADAWRDLRMLMGIEG